MHAVRARDAKALLSFVDDAQAVGVATPFTTELLDNLTHVMACDFATFYRPNREPHHSYVPCSKEVAELTHEWCEFEGEHGFELATTTSQISLSQDVITWSQFVATEDRRRFRTTAWAGRFRIVDAARVLWRSSAGDDAVLSLHSQERDFAESDRSRLMFLHPFVLGLIHAADARQLLGDLLDAVDAGLDEGRSGFVLLRRSGVIEHASPAARALLEQWFRELGTVLPTEIASWLRSDMRKPLRIARDGKHLVVRAPTRLALVLTEDPQPPAHLTKREREVLRCIAAGHSTAEIALALCVTPATVSKHLEHIYRKLGVSSRTAALAAIRHLVLTG